MHIKILIISTITALLTACGAGDKLNTNNNSNPDVVNSSYLAKPTGQYGVGYQDIHLLNNRLCPDKYFTGINQGDFSDGNKNEVGGTNFCHEMMLRIYYPTHSKIELKDAYYAPFISQYQNYLDELSLSKEELNHYRLLLNEIKTFSNKNDINFVNDSQFPIVIFSPGAGMSVQEYENFISNLVSHGYIIVGVNSAFISDNVVLPNKHVVKQVDFLPDEDFQEQYNDFEYVLINLKSILNKNMPQIASQINFNEIGAFGHSIGAKVIVDYLHKNVYDLKLQAAVALEVGGSLKKDNNSVYKQVDIPFMHQVAAMRFHPQAMDMEEKNGFDKSDFSDMGKNSYGIIHRTSKLDYMSTSHKSFSDFSTLISNKGMDFITKSLKLFTGGTEDGWEFTQLTNDYLVRFFDVYLKNKQDSKLKDCKATSLSIDITCNTK